MQQSRGDFLARPSRAVDQDAAAGIGDTLERGAYLRDCIAVAVELLAAD
jgi:hypothetical protein